VIQAGKQWSLGHGRGVLVFGSAVGGDRAALAQEPAGGAPIVDPPRSFVICEDTTVNAGRWSLYLI
jgi:hypothetical protein